jgi:regulator of replication initiation timing
MKFASIVLAFALIFGVTPGVLSDTGKLSPVTRVVELLQQLAKQVEKEGKKEEDLYEDFVCWGKSIINQKTASNAAAEARINELETYIADLEAGRIELTDERVTLEKEIAGLMSDLEQAAALRKKEKADFLEAEDEMTKAITALKGAIDTLEEATKDHKEGVLLAVRARLQGAAKNGGMVELAQRQASLKHAVELGERFLAKADATFLRRVLLGDVPKVDWKKLNRKATFKMAYKARSFKIQEVLKKMHQTFTINLKDATDKEADAKAEYEELKKAKTGQLTSTQEALSKMESENGANGMSKQDAQDEVDGLKQQVKDDTKFIAQTEKSLADKKDAWKVRSELRAGELAAISKAIYILNNDDARDLMKKSFSSQESFVQLAQTTHKAKVRRVSSAAQALQEAARRSGDERLLSLVSALKDGPSESVKVKFDPIIKAIDKMIKLLKSEEDKDLEIKQTCEEDRMEDTRTAIVASRAIDDMTDLINKLAAKIAECKKTIEELLEEHKKTKEELAKATRMRDDENAAWKVTDKDDKDAAATVQSAKEVLEGFYKENDLVLVQKRKQPVTGMAAGEAPPPPPPTWEGDYGGKTGESMGIVAIMEMVYEDIVKDRADAKADEDNSQKEYDAFKEDSEKHMEELKDEKEATEKAMGNAETKKSETEKERGTKKGDLDAVLEKIASINPNCEYFEVNYPMRRTNRQIEIDGLAKAKAILQGGVFDEAPDPNREIKPGDAFLQRRPGSSGDTR